MSRTRTLLLLGIAFATSAPATEGMGVGVAVGLGFPPRQQNTGIGPRVLFLGDSLVAGQGVAPERTFAYRAIDRVNAVLATRRIAKRVEATYAGVDGAKAVGSATRLKEAFARAKATVLFLELGADDAVAGTPPAEVERNLEETIVAAKEAGMKVILAGLRVPATKTVANAAEYEAIYPRLARKHDALFVPSLLEDVAGRPERTLADGAHPNEKGHARIAETIEPYLEVALDVPGASLPATK